MFRKTISITFIISFCFIQTIPAQYQQVEEQLPEEQLPFEGLIVYKFKMKDTNQDKEYNRVMVERMGDTQRYYIKRNKVHTKLNGSYKKAEFYNGINDTIFVKYQNIPAVFVQPHGSSGPGYKLKSIKIRKNAGKVNGIKCSVMIIKTDRGLIKQYYNPDYKVLYEDFKDNHERFYNFYVQQTESLPLKTVTKLDGMRIIGEAVEIKRMKLEDSLFEKPDLPIAEWPEQ